MIQLEKFVCGGVGGGWVADTNYLYPARWGWIIMTNCVLYRNYRKHRKTDTAQVLYKFMVVVGGQLWDAELINNSTLRYV